MTIQDHKHLKPALVLNADYQPLSYAPLSVWSWQDAVKAVFQDRVDVIKSYDELIRSPTFAMPAPAVIALRQYQKAPENAAFTRMNVRLRDRHMCVYCGAKDDLNLDHVLAKSLGNIHSWNNTVLSCVSCNQKKGNKTVEQAGMRLPYQPYQPTTHQLMNIAREFPPSFQAEEWLDFAYWTVPLDS